MPSPSAASRGSVDQRAVVGIWTLCWSLCKANVAHGGTILGIQGEGRSHGGSSFCAQGKIPEPWGTLARPSAMKGKCCPSSLQKEKESPGQGFGEDRG